MNIERDNFYTTRDGQRAKCLTTEYPGGYPCLILLDDGKTFSVGASGKHGYLSAYSLDIIGPWVEPVKAIEAWGVAGDDGWFIAGHSSLASAMEAVNRLAKQCPGVMFRAVHMREVVDGAK